MRPDLKPLSAQTLVITGATSGIGLALARTASGRGAKLLLVARNEQALRALCEELNARGGHAGYAVADVADTALVRAAAARADELYGGFDAWINNAGVSIFGQITETPLEDQRRLFETNYWGVVNGSLTAAEHLKGREGGGVIVNIGSVLSDVALPVQGVYSASKHAVKGFTNALRAELSRSAPQVVVTLIKPSALDTPYNAHARNFTAEPVKNPPPVYAGQLAVEAVIYALERPVRDLTVGGGGRALAILGQLLPAVADPLLAWATPRLTRAGAGAADGPEALHKAGRDLQERGAYTGVRQTSLYTAAQMKPQATAAALVGGAAALLLTLSLRDALRIHRIKREVRRRVRAEYEAAET